MGETELKAALRQDGESRMRGLWQEAEAVIKQRRKEIETEEQRLRVESERSAQAEVTSLSTNLLFAANTRAMNCRLHAEARLEKRLLDLSQQLITELQGDSRDKLWQALCRELPDIDWASITTLSADQSLARRDYPAAKLKVDDTIGGGVIATNKSGTIRVDNSLRCRLLRAWPDLLPILMNDLRTKVNNNETPLNNTAL